MSKGDISKGEHAVRGAVIQSPLSLSFSLSLSQLYALSIRDSLNGDRSSPFLTSLCVSTILNK